MGGLDGLGRRERRERGDHKPFLHVASSPCGAQQSLPREEHCMLSCARRAVAKSHINDRRTPLAHSKGRAHLRIERVESLVRTTRVLRTHARMHERTVMPFKNAHNWLKVAPSFRSAHRPLRRSAQIIIVSATAGVLGWHDSGLDRTAPRTLCDSL